MFFKKAKLERELINEIKTYAHVEAFPERDSKVISDFLVSYKKGNEYMAFEALRALNTLEKYPDLYKVWDDLMKKYKKLGLFPKWRVDFFE